MARPSFVSLRSESRFFSNAYLFEEERKWNAMGLGRFSIKVEGENLS